MRLRFLFLICVMAAVPSAVKAQTQGQPQTPATSLAGPQAVPSAPPPALVDEDILAAPLQFREFVRRVALAHDGAAPRSQALARAFFSSPESGGLGIVYDNEKTRTVAEVWKDRKANCISLTAMFVSACRVIGVKVNFAEAPSISRWVRYGSMVYNEKHMVAAIQVDITSTLTADFGGIPSSYGTLRVRPISESRFRALFHSNRAVEWMRRGDLDAAMVDARASVSDDPESGIGWNIYGVVQKAMGDTGSAEGSFRKALMVDPENGAACGNLEDLYEGEGKATEAAAYRNMGLKLRDKDPYFHAFLAKEALGSGANDEALAQIRKAIRGQGMEPGFYLILAQAELNRGEHRAAAKAVEKAIHWSLPDQRKRMESKLDLIRSQT